MTALPSRSPRTIQIADHLWESLESLAADMGLERDALVNQALFALARQHGYPIAAAREAAAVPSPAEPEPLVTLEEELAIAAALREAPRAPSVPPPVKIPEPPVRPSTPPPPGLLHIDLKEEVAELPVIRIGDSAPAMPLSQPISTPGQPSERVAPLLSVPDLGTALLPEEREEARARVARKAAELEREILSEPELPAVDVTRPTVAPVSRKPSQPRVLVVLDGDGVELGRVGVPRYLIGRGKECDLVLPSPKVSREHAQVVQEGESFFIEDLGSSNGTWFEKRRITRQLIADGDLFALSEFKLSFRIE